MTLRSGHDGCLFYVKSYSVSILGSYFMFDHTLFQKVNKIEIKSNQIRNLENCKRPLPFQAQVDFQSLKVTYTPIQILYYPLEFKCSVT